MNDLNESFEDQKKKDELANESSVVKKDQPPLKNIDTCDEKEMIRTSCL